MSADDPIPESDLPDESAPPADDEPIADDDEDVAEDRLFSLIAFGLMILLFICVVLVLIADRRPPAGL